ncbi:hypothetical protein LJR045_001167 [Microbacterium sp. LjRoot45]
MKPESMRPAMSRASAVLLSFALVATAAPALAVDGEEEPLPVDETATLILGAPSTLLTLPDDDGVRDEATLALSSDVATDVTVDVLAADGIGILRTQSVALPADALSTSIAVPVTDLPAGTLSVRATPAVGDPVSVALTVGSGRPASVALSLGASSIFSWSGSGRPKTTATVVAVDETALAVPFTGSVVASVGGKTQTVSVASSTGSAATATVTGSKLAAGSGSARALVTGAGSDVVASAAVPLTVRTTAVTATKVSVSLATIYPSKDGYKDATKIAVRTSTTTGATIPVTGSVKVSRDGKTVTSWKLTSSKTWSATWAGTVSGRLVPGTYTVTVAVKGPEGGTKTSSTKVVVKKGKLVTKTTSTWYSAQRAFDDWIAFDSRSRCAEVGSSSFRCVGATEGFLSVAAVGTFGVPAAVRNSYKYGDGTVRVVLSTTDLAGTVAWGYNRTGAETGKSDLVVKGDRSLGRLSLKGSARSIDLAVVLAGKSRFTSDKVKIEYTYKVMSTS